METASKVMWDFNKQAYDMGILDEATQLISSLIDPETDIIEFLSVLEDNSKDIDVESIDKNFENELLPLIKNLTNENSILALKEIITIMGPLVKKIQEEEGTLKAAAERYKNLWNNFSVLIPAILPFLLSKKTSAIETFMKERGGQLIGKGITSLSSIINNAYQKDPEIVSSVITNMIENTDSKEIKKATDIIISSIIDKKPKILGWSGRAVLKRLKKRISKP